MEIARPGSGFIAGVRRRTMLWRMKKGRGLERALQPIERRQLQEMPTGALLARLKRLRWCEESRECSDLSDAEVMSAVSLILFKADPAWQSAYVDVREELDSRDHRSSKP